MTIGVVGLGLIGGSICKAIKSKTNHRCMGADLDKQVIKKAIFCSAIDEELSSDKLKDCDIVFVCLYPKQTVEYINENVNNFKKHGLVCDTCGVKEYIFDNISTRLKENDVEFLGTHPMAGREFSGFDYSIETLFENASMVLTPLEDNTKTAIDSVSKLARMLGFAKIVHATPKLHDETIAYTSQLAHVVSNAYVKSDTLNNESGFSAGSFLDLTRVAKLNEKMWTPLFLANTKPLLHEIKTIIKNLQEYEAVLENHDEEKLSEILKHGSDLKVASLERRAQK